MSHSDTLKLLTPLELGETYTLDISIEGNRLNLADARDADLLREVFANSAYELLNAWERNYTPEVFFDDPLQARQAKLVQKMSELGRLDRAYYVQMAAALGYAIILEELHPFMPGWSCAGDELGDDGSDWCWRVYYTEQDVFIFRAGESAAGENLSYSFANNMFNLFEALKPADTFVEFIEV